MTWQNPAILYDNRLDNGTPVSSVTVDTGYDVLNLRDWRNYTFWQATGAGPFYLTVNCASAKTADTLVIHKHNFGTIGATVSLECSSDNFSADTTVALAGFVPTNDKIIYKQFTSVSKQYWRLKITVPSSSSPRIGILCFGDRLNFPYGVTAPYDPLPQKVQSESNSSQAGNLLGSIVDYYELNPKPQWQYLSATWVRDTFMTFWDNHAQGMTPFFWSWEPGDHPADTLLVSVRADSGMSMAYESGQTIMNLSLDLVGIKET